MSWQRAQRLPATINGDSLLSMENVRVHANNYNIADMKGDLDIDACSVSTSYSRKIENYDKTGHYNQRKWERMISPQETKDALRNGERFPSFNSREIFAYKNIQVIIDKDDNRAHNLAESAMTTENSEAFERELLVNVVDDITKNILITAYRDPCIKGITGVEYAYYRRLYNCIVSEDKRNDDLMKNNVINLLDNIRVREPTAKFTELLSLYLKNDGFSVNKTKILNFTVDDERVYVDGKVKKTNAQYYGSNRMTPLIVHAASRGYMQIVDLLLQNGASPFIPTFVDAPSTKGNVIHHLLKASNRCIWTPKRCLEQCLLSMIEHEVNQGNLTQLYSVLFEDSAAEKIESDTSTTAIPVENDSSADVINNAETVVRSIYYPLHRIVYLGMDRLAQSVINLLKDYDGDYTLQSVNRVYKECILQLLTMQHMKVSIPQKKTVPCCAPGYCFYYLEHTRCKPAVCRPCETINQMLNESLPTQHSGLICKCVPYAKSKFRIPLVDQDPEMLVKQYKQSGLYHRQCDIEANNMIRDIWSPSPLQPIPAPRIFPAIPEGHTAFLPSRPFMLQSLSTNGFVGLSTNYRLELSDDSANALVFEADPDCASMYGFEDQEHRNGWFVCRASGFSDKSDAKSYLNLHKDGSMDYICDSIDSSSRYFTWRFYQLPSCIEDPSPIIKIGNVSGIFIRQRRASNSDSNYLTRAKSIYEAQAFRLIEATGDRCTNQRYKRTPCSIM